MDWLVKYQPFLIGNASIKVNLLNLSNFELLQVKL